MLYTRFHTKVYTHSCSDVRIYLHIYLLDEQEHNGYYNIYVMNIVDRQIMRTNGFSTTLVLQTGKCNSRVMRFRGKLLR